MQIRPRLMSPLVLIFALVTAPGCVKEDGDGSGGDGSGTGGTAGTVSGDGIDGTGPGPGSGEQVPYRDEWRVEADADFVHTDNAGVPQIFSLTIGGRGTDDNFNNRGDVIVNFDGPADRIIIELRRFTFAISQEQAQERFDELSLWAFSGDLARPQDKSPQDDCIAAGWHNDCEIRVFYEGLSQLRRDGADIRVTLPPDYRQRVTVVTQDSIEDDDYFNRGNVCISNLFASADIETESGTVWVSLADDATPAPKCSQAQIDACANWTDAMGAPAPWAPECDCIAAGGGEFGLLTIDSRVGSAADITVDMPAGLWSAVYAENQGEGQDAAGDHCEAIVTAPGAEEDATGNDFPWQAKYTINYPGQPAILGAGYTVQASSEACGSVAYTEHPEQFVGVGNGAMQMSEERGNIEICSGCIAQSCDELIP